VSEEEWEWVEASSHPSYWSSTADRPAVEPVIRDHPHLWAPIPGAGWYCGARCTDGELCGVIWSATVHSPIAVAAYVAALEAS